MPIKYITEQLLHKWIEKSGSKDKVSTYKEGFYRFSIISITKEKNKI